MLEVSQHQEPTGETGNTPSELLAGSSVATGGLDIHEDHPREPGLSLMGCQASSRDTAHDRPVAGYPAAGDIGLGLGTIPPTHAPWGAFQRSPRERPPTLKSSPGTPAPPAASEFVKTISGTRCLGLGGQSRTFAAPGGEEPSSLAVRWPGPPLGWVG